MSIKVYSSIFAVLIGSTAFELAIIGQPLARNVLVTSVMGLAGIKALLVALFFQHLKDEPRSVSSLLLLGLVAAFILLTLSLLSIGALHGV
ncbi:MAG: cytochrome C oxidase subunit IV family protein [Thaumarchaeota archaeon]|nr:cytochrome C oxidase subunit IV family protein [Nitrososphaerota archaeon]